MARRLSSRSASHRLGLGRRTLREWAVRAMLAIVGAGLGYGAVSAAFANVIRASAPERAHALAPHNGRITALLASKLLLPDASAADQADATDLARTALRQDATAIDAVATLGLLAQARGDQAAAQRLFAYADTLSRRDLPSRLGMIEQAVARNDVPGVLRHYDVALRTSRLASDILFPVLSAAIADPTVRDRLVDTLAARPSWSPAFLAYVTMQGPDTLAVAGLLRALHRRHVELPSDAGAIIIDRLLGQDRAVAAWEQYALITPGADPRRSRDPRFARDPSAASAFDWRPLEDSGIAAAIARDTDGGMADFSVVTAVAGPVLRQTQMLPPGDYRIAGRSTGIAQPAGSLPYWSLTCRSGRELGRVTVPASAQDGGRFAGRLTVPAGCPVQQLTLVARASDDIAGVTGQIREIAIFPARQARQALR